MDIFVAFKLFVWFETSHGRSHKKMETEGTEVAKFETNLEPALVPDALNVELEEDIVPNRGDEGLMEGILIKDSEDVLTDSEDDDVSLYL